MLRMEHFELHIVNDLSGVQSALNAGLLEEGADFRCEHCGEVVGEDLDEFYPFAIVLDEFDEVWFVCDECFTPVLDPQGF